MTVGIWVLGNQLWLGQAALASVAGDRSATPVLLIESHQFAQERPYHRQKLVLVWSAMGHFAEALETAGWPVTYRRADQTEVALRDWLQTHRITELRLMDPVDRPFMAWLRGLDLP
ncbi:MAG: cryptochrome/photolyase family protein, partial [Nodosilinea sp.]